MSPAPVKSAVLNCVETILSVTTCHKMLSRHWSLLLICPESITAILYSVAVLSNSFTNFRKFQNNAARLIFRTPKSDHITPVLHTLHWLLDEQRIEYKLLLFAFKSVNNDSPSYVWPPEFLHSSPFVYCLRRRVCTRALTGWVHLSVRGWREINSTAQLFAFVIHFASRFPSPLRT